MVATAPLVRRVGCNWVVVLEVEGELVGDEVFGLVDGNVVGEAAVKATVGFIDGEVGFVDMEIVREAVGSLGRA